MLWFGGTHELSKNIAAKSGAHCHWKKCLTPNFRSDLSVSCRLPADTRSNRALGSGCELGGRKRAGLTLRKDSLLCISPLVSHHANRLYLPERTDKGNEMLGWSEIAQELIAECCSITVGARKTFRISVLCLKRAVLIPCLYDRQSCSRAPDENKLLGYADVMYTSYQKNVTPRKAWYYVKPIHINLSYCIYPPWEDYKGYVVCLMYCWIEYSFIFIY